MGDSAIHDEELHNAALEGLEDEEGLSFSSSLRLDESDQSPVDEELHNAALEGLEENSAPLSLQKRDSPLDGAFDELDLSPLSSDSAIHDEELHNAALEGLEDE